MPIAEVTDYARRVLAARGSRRPPPTTREKGSQAIGRFAQAAEWLETIESGLLTGLDVATTILDAAAEAADAAIALDALGDIAPVSEAAIVFGIAEVVSDLPKWYVKGLVDLNRQYVKETRRSIQRSRTRRRSS